MEEPVDPLETFWDQILSRQPQQILSAFNSLKDAERQAVVAHLRRMVNEPGWQPEQRASAEAALRALRMNE